MNSNLESYENVFSGLVGGILVIYGIILLIVIVASIVSIIALWKLFNKAGKKGWYSIIPFYSSWVLIEIAGLNWWWFLLIISNSIVSVLDIEGLYTIASLVSLFASFNCYYNISKKFNKETGYSVCAGIFSFIFVLIFGFSKKEVYDINIPVSKNGVFGKSEVASYSNSNNSFSQAAPNNIDNNVSQEMNNSNLETLDNENIINEEVIFCGNCGTKFAIGDKFCPNCGKQRL